MLRFGQNGDPKWIPPELFIHLDGAIDAARALATYLILGALGDGSGWDLRVCPAAPAASGNLDICGPGNLEILGPGNLGI